MNNITVEKYEKRAEAIGNRLREERKLLGLTQDKLAEKLFISSRQTVARWESGSVLPSMSDFLSMCCLFNCELGYLLCEYDCKTRAATDIKAETGLSEKAIYRLQQAYKGNGICVETFDKKALNSILEYNSGDIVSLIADYLFSQEKPVKLDDGRILTADTIAASYLLEISNELKVLKRKINGGIE